MFIQLCCTGPSIWQNLGKGARLYKLLTVSYIASKYMHSCGCVAQGLSVHWVLALCQSSNRGDVFHRGCCLYKGALISTIVSQLQWYQTALHGQSWWPGIGPRVWTKFNRGYFYTTRLMATCTLLELCHICVFWGDKKVTAPLPPHPQRKLVFTDSEYNHPYNLIA